MDWAAGSVYKLRQGREKIGHFFILLLLLLPVNFFSPSVVYAADTRKTIVTKHVILYFKSAADIKTLNDNIDFTTSISIGGLFATPSQKDIERQLADKVDRLFVKAQRILDMRKPMKKVKISVHSTEEQLAATYKKIYKSNSSPRGWYIYKYNTVYICADDVHEGMLAHELGHAIIDNYLSVKPPRATAEILARYIDKHLFDEVKKY